MPRLESLLQSRRQTMDRVKQDLKVDQQEDALAAFKEEVQRLEEKVRAWRRDGETFRQDCKDYFSWDPMDQVEDGDPGRRESSLRRVRGEST